MPYYSIRNTITHIDGLIFKDQLLIVLNTLRKEIMQQAHAAHGGISACMRRLRDIAYWPGINNDIENYITTFPSCIKHVCLCIVKYKIRKNHYYNMHEEKHHGLKSA